MRACPRRCGRAACGCRARSTSMSRLHGQGDLQTGHVGHESRDHLARDLELHLRRQAVPDLLRSRTRCMDQGAGEGPQGRLPGVLEGRRRRWAEEQALSDAGKALRGLDRFSTDRPRSCGPTGLGCGLGRPIPVEHPVDDEIGRESAFPPLVRRRSGHVELSLPTHRLRGAGGLAGRRSTPRGNSRRRPGDGVGGVRQPAGSTGASPHPVKPRGPAMLIPSPGPSPFAQASVSLRATLPPGSPGHGDRIGAGHATAAR